MKTVQVIVSIFHSPNPSHVDHTDQSYSKENEVMGSSSFSPSHTEVNLGTFLRCAPELEGEQSCGLRPSLNLWALICLQLDGVRIELTCRTPSWCRRESCDVQKRPHIW